MSVEGSKRVIIAAFVGNFAIAVTKFAAAAYTGSSAMLSEGIHSLVDTGNQALLLYGLKRAGRPADDRHPFGYGKEMYFWAFVVAILIFAVGAGVSLYEGIERVRHPTTITNPTVNYVVLGLALIFESGSWYVAWKEFNAVRGEQSMLAAITTSKDPAIFTVLLEDTAALLGLLIALIALIFSEILAMPVLDGVASIGIGCLLALVAILLAYETKGLLIGEAADPALEKSVRRLLVGQRHIQRVNEVLTLHQGPRHILVTVSVDFSDGITADQVESAVSEIEVRIKRIDPAVTRVFVEAQSWARHLRSTRNT
jgi:cation diffusion facilitator family transporter